MQRDKYVAFSHTEDVSDILPDFDKAEAERIFHGLPENAKNSEIIEMLHQHPCNAEFIHAVLCAYHSADYPF